jgi:hypothetical protein
LIFNRRKSQRLCRNLKYEEVYLKAYASVSEAKAGIGGWLSLYNEERFHQALRTIERRAKSSAANIARGNVDDPLRGTALLPPLPRKGQKAGKCSPSPTFPPAPPQPPQQKGLTMT